jgi:chromosome segregation ATPase
MNMARSISEEGYFYISDLYKKVIDETLIEGMIIFETIQELLNKRVFVPYEVKTKKGKKIVRKFEAFQKNTDPLTEYREIVVSLNNKALNAITRNDYEEAIKIYQKIADLARVSNLNQEWRAYRNKVEAMKVELARKPKTPKPKAAPRSEISTSYSVKVSSLSHLRNKYEKEEKERQQLKEEEDKNSRRKISAKKEKKISEASPKEIEEIKKIISPKKETKSFEYPKLKTEVTSLEDEIDRLDSEIEEIDHEIKKKRRKESFEDLTPLEKALKFGLDLKDEEIFDSGQDNIRTEDEDIQIVDKKIVKIKQENIEEEEEKELNIYDLNNHCPNCQNHISTMNLKLIIKGYDPECDNCGKKLILKELIKKPTDAKSLLESD